MSQPKKSENALCVVAPPFVSFLTSFISCSRTNPPASSRTSNTMTTVKRQTRKAAAPKTGLIAGFNAGHKVTPRAKPVSRKTRLGLPHKRLRAVKAIIHEVAGFSTLDKRVVELLRVGKEKRAIKVCKKRLGSFNAGKKRKQKVEDLLRATVSKKK